MHIHNKYKNQLLVFMLCTIVSSAMQNTYFNVTSSWACSFDSFISAVACLVGCECVCVCIYWESINKILLFKVLPSASRIANDNLWLWVNGLHLIARSLCFNLHKK